MTVNEWTKKRPGVSKWEILTYIALIPAIVGLAFFFEWVIG